jgi:chaperonin GroEL (HSP60 family)
MSKSKNLEEKNNSTGLSGSNPHNSFGNIKSSKKDIHYDNKSHNDKECDSQNQIDEKNHNAKDHGDVRMYNDKDDNRCDVKEYSDEESLGNTGNLYDNDSEKSSEYYSRTQGESAQKNNISAAKLISQTLKSTLGPKGMDKMIIDEYGNTITTNDGATILSEMILAHPVARMIAEISKNQEKEVGDGTTTIAILVGELLSNAEKLLDQKIHPILIIDGYKKALDIALNALESLTFNVDLTNSSLSHSDLLKIAKTAMTGKGAENSKEFLSRLCVDGVVALKNQEDLGKHLIKIASIPGENIEDSILFNGVVLENDFTSSSSPITQKGSKVILLNTPLEIKESEIDAKIQITNPSQIKEFIEAQDSILKEMAIKLSKKGINVVFCQKGIDDLVSHYLSELGISSIRRVPYSDMIRLSKSTGAKIVSNVDELRDADIGLAQTIEKKTIYNESYIFLKGTKQNSQTIIIRGANTQVSDEIIRALDDALGDLITLIKDKRAVVGAGAFELALYSILTQEAKSYPANEQIFINLFAEAILSIPKTLAENAGFDFEHFKRKFDSLSKIDETNTIEFSKKKNTEFLNLKELYGIGVYNGQLIKPFELGIIEPYMVKYRAILSASELAIAILRIDDVIVAKPKESSPFL